MKIGYFADGVWGQEALKKILRNSDFQVVFIVPRYDKLDQELKKIALQLDIPFIIHPNVNDKGFLEIVSNYGADIFVSMSFNQILKAPIIDCAKKGFINCHAGALPFYRGRNVLNWVLINGEKSFGVTVHYVDEGIDTGDIILQKEYEMGLYDNYESILEKAYLACSSTLMEALLMIKRNQVKRIKQSSIHPVGFYCGRRIDGDEWLDWNWTSKRIHNFVRGISKPGPCARTIFNNKTIALLETELIEDAPDYIGTPGEVMGSDSKGVVIKTGDNTIRVNKIADINEGNSLENERTPNYKIGTRMGLNIYRKIRALENEMKGLIKS